MPDTGAPWNIPYLDGTELVRAYPAFSEDLADAVADALDANVPTSLDAAVITSGTFNTARIPNLDANKITSGTLAQARLPVGTVIAVKSAIFTGTQTNSTAGSANFAVTSLSITHAVADAANRLIISAFLGAAGNSSGFGNVGLAVHDGTGLIAIGTADGSRTRVGAGGTVAGTGGNIIVSMPSVTFVHTPGAGEKTYTVRAINIDPDTRTVYINRSQTDTNAAFQSRAVSSLVIQEVKA
jgi:hypothetical protein